MTGEGLAAAVADVDVVIHAASDPRGDPAADEEGTRRLAAAARAAGVGHVVYVSIVGIDRIPFPYYARKLAAERALAASGQPYSILRATQFHSFVDFLLGKAAQRGADRHAAAGGLSRAVGGCGGRGRTVAARR